jgi:hypothetical protein
VDFINVFRLTQHVSANGCHLQEDVGALEATQVLPVLLAYTDYNPSSVASVFQNNWPHWTDRNPYTPTIQTILE